MLSLHIVVALTGLVASALQIFMPHRRLNQLSVGSLLATGVTGSLLIWQSPQHLTRACISGIAYLAAYSALGYLSARNRKTAQ